MSGRGDVGDASAADGQAARARWYPPPLLACLILIIVLAVGGGVWASLTLRSVDQRAAGQVAATEVAEQVARGLMGLGKADASRELQELAAVTTGSFGTQLQTLEAPMTQMLADGNVVSQGEVRASGVVSLSGDEAVVLVAGDARLSNIQTKGAEQQRSYRFRMTVQRGPDTWRVSNVEFVA